MVRAVTVRGERFPLAGLFAERDRLPPVAAKGLTECWRDAWAAKPSDWRLMGVVCGPREVDPSIHSAEELCAWAKGPKGERLEGRGSGPHDALLALTVKLKELGG